MNPVTIDVRDGWHADYLKAAGVNGCNDDEHDLLCEIGDGIGRALGVESAPETALALLRPVSEDEA